eukprot:8600849-Pyramimonas_sp.AAC.2
MARYARNLEGALGGPSNGPCPRRRLSRGESGPDSPRGTIRRGRSSRGEPFDGCWRGVSRGESGFDSPQETIRRVSGSRGAPQRAAFAAAPG